MEATSTKNFTCVDCKDQSIVVLGECADPIENEVKSQLEEKLQFELSNSILVKCKNCGLVSRLPRTSTELLDALYSELPADRWDYKNTNTKSWKLAVDWLNKNTDGSVCKQILDVGAFDGAFLEVLQGRWNKFAIEPTQAVVDSLKRKNIEKIGSFLRDCSVEWDNSFDVITMFDVLEHLQSPMHEIAQIKRLLRKDGLLILSSGNSFHWSFRLLLGNHWYVQPRKHLCIANKQYLEFIAQKMNFEVIHFLKHSHKECEWKLSLYQTMQTLHFWLIQNGGINRKFAKLIQLLMRDRSLIHQQHPPHATAIQDHFFVVLRNLE